MYFGIKGQDGEESYFVSESTSIAEGGMVGFAVMMYAT
jgi:hypothetical protein